MSNTDGTAIASAAFTATQNSADLYNSDGRGVVVTLDVTAIVTAPSITLSIEGKDPASGKYYTLLSGAAVTTVSTNRYRVHPAITETANVDVADLVPFVWRVRIVHGNANSITYSVGYTLVG